MTNNNRTGKKQTQLNRTEILRAVVADAESMGLRDKDKIEELTSRVIERLERPQTLPGMEDLVPKSSLRGRPTPTRAEIQAIVHEIMAREEPVKAEEIKPAMEKTAPSASLRTSLDNSFVSLSVTGNKYGLSFIRSNINPLNSSLSLSFVPIFIFLKL